MKEGLCKQYDLCIVGAGMVGSAIARHASAVHGFKICLIGPQEPKVRACETGRDIFGAHYDSGRITRCTASDPVWSTLASRSISRYHELEKMSGVKFYHPVGCMSIGWKTFVDSDRPPAGHTVNNITSDCLKKEYSYLDFSDEDTGILNESGGWIDPRKHVAAQLIAASNQGCDIIRDIVKSVSKIKMHGDETMMKILTENGNEYMAEKVILATNVFINNRHLLPQEFRPEFLASPQTVVLGEVDEADAEKLRGMPTMLYRGSGSSNWHNTYPRCPDGSIKYYMFPPILYPDGKMYIKIGNSDEILKEFLKKDDISRWHSLGGDPWLTDHLKRLLQTMFKGIRFHSFTSDSCVSMVTPTRRPYIDKVHDQLGVAIGGNGYAAKSSDEIGRIAAAMMMNLNIDSDIPMDTFKLVTETSMSKL